MTAPAAAVAPADVCGSWVRSVPVGSPMLAGMAAMEPFHHAILGFLHHNNIIHIMQAVSSGEVAQLGSVSLEPKISKRSSSIIVHLFASNGITS